jgi:hypothetical protein
MLNAPRIAQPLFEKLAPAFTQPTAQRMLWLTLGAILTVGRRTFTRILITLAGLVEGHFSSFYRLFSRPAWSCWRVARALARIMVDLAPPGEPVVVLCDSTVSEHPGDQVYGKGKHRDAVRSSHTFLAWLWGHKWVVLAIALPLPYIRRPWALPVLIALYRPESLNQQEGRRHKTQGDLARQLMRVLLGWFPEKKFLLVGDGDFSSHETAHFAQRHKRQLTFVGRYYPDASLYEPPPPYSGKGRPRVKGAKCPAPEQVVASRIQKLWPACVAWYGGERRQVALAGGTGHWHKGGLGLVEVRWVYVEDRQGTHRPEYFFSTDPTMTLKQIVEYYTLRWNIETTFQEVREHLGFGTTRHWKPAAVQRVEPWLFVLYSLVSLIYHAHLQQHAPRLRQWPWRTKEEPTFSNAMETVRRLIWVESVFAHPVFQPGMKKLDPKTREILLNHLTQAA